MGDKNLLLSDLSLPWTDQDNPKKMNVLSADATLLDIDRLEIDKDIALKKKTGEFVGRVPIQVLSQTLLQQWKTSHHYYNTLLQTIGDAVTAIDENGKIISWNERAAEMFHWPEEEILGQPIADYFEKEKLQVMSVLTEGKNVRRKYHQPNENLHVLINASPVIMNERIIGGISIEHDITDMVKLSNKLSQTTAYVRDLETKIGDGNSNDRPFSIIKGRSPALNSAVQMAEKVAISDVPVLITGESGVGKELFAQSIHAASRNADGPFIDINCGAIPTSLFESELFGYEKGAFTGANTGGKKGKFDAARGGTLFLDEIGELPLDLQVKLLRVIQQKRFYRVGGTTPISIEDVRIVSATNQHLDEMVRRGEFREDLYYRLNVVSIHVPPLRERMEDIPHLIQLFLQEFSIKYSKPVPDIDPDAMYWLLHHDWPGNIRQLRNVMERLMILTDDDTIHARHFPKDFILYSEPSLDEQPTAALDYNAATQDEKTQIQQALIKTYGNKSAAADLLGVSRATLYNKLKKYGL